MPSLTAIATLLAATTARDITFPPISPQYGSQEQHPLGAGVGFDLGPLGALGYGLTTFANLPYVYCLSEKGNEDVEKFDIAFLGAGFDTVCLLFTFFYVLSSK
jgi:agmatinase